MTLTNRLKQAVEQLKFILFTNLYKHPPQINKTK